MAFIGKKEIVSVFQNNKPMQVIYQCGKVIWQAIRSCFGSGIWVNNKPWINDEAWKNE
jgi:hypothetical protein